MINQNLEFHGRGHRCVHCHQQANGLNGKIVHAEKCPATPSPDLNNYGHLLIRRAVLRDDWISDAIFDLAANRQKNWDTQQWDTLLAEMHASKLTVEAWLMIYT